MLCYQPYLYYDIYAGGSQVSSIFIFLSCHMKMAQLCQPKLIWDKIVQSMTNKNIRSTRSCNDDPKSLCNDSVQWYRNWNPYEIDINSHQEEEKEVRKMNHGVIYLVHQTEGYADHAVWFIPANIFLFLSWEWTTTKEFLLECL